MKWLVYVVWVIVWFFIHILIFSLLGQGLIRILIDVGIFLLGFRFINSRFNFTDPVKKTDKPSKQTAQKSDHILSTASEPSIDSDDVYGFALAEVNEGRMILGLWARCLADSDGDKDKATAFYIKRRAVQLNS